MTPPSQDYLPAQDLTGDRGLRGCGTIEFQGVERPALGRIALVARLGRGGMGVVYYGVNPRLGTQVAIKILPPDLLRQNEDLLRRFVREAQLSARLNSPHLVQVIDVDEDPATGVHFLVMEYVRGMSAHDWMKSLKAQGLPGAEEAAALEVCIGATKGLEAAHLEGV